MKKRLIFSLLLMGTLTVTIHSCRTDEIMSGTEQTQKEKISFFERFEKEKSLSKNTESANYALPFAQSVLGYFKNHPEKKTELESKYGVIDLKVSSQTIGAEAGDERKLIFFPILKEGKVMAVIAGVVNAERDYLYFDVHTNTHADVYYLIDKFQKYYDSQVMSKGSVTEIAEIVIVVTRPIKLTYYDGWGGNGGTGNGGHDMGGGNGDFTDGSGGSSSGTPNTTNTDPCAKLKAQNSTPDFKGKLNYLETNLDLTKETGWVEKKGGVWEYKDVATTNDDRNSLSMGEPTKDMLGYSHTHVNDYEDSDGNTRTGFKIFSPADVIYFNQMVALAQQNGTPLDDIYAVMVSGKGNYQIRFTGVKEQIKTVYPNTKNQYNDMYKEYFKNNKGRSDEVNFLKFLEEIMYVKGVTLIKINSDGTTVKKSLNSTRDGVNDANCN